MGELFHPHHIHCTSGINSRICSQSHSLCEREVLRADLLIAGKDVGTLNQVLELTDISRKVIAFEIIHRLSADGAHWQSKLGGDLPGQPVAESRNILEPLPQGGDMNRLSRQAVIQILPEQPISNALRQVSAGGDEHPNVHNSGFGGSDARQPALGYYAKQLGLCGWRNLSGFVQEERTFIGSFDESLACATRASIPTRSFPIWIPIT